MLDVATVASGATSSHSAPGQPRGVAGARRDTRRRNTGVLLRDAKPRRVTGANTPWRSARTAEAPILRRQTSARRRGRPAAMQRGGGLPPHVEAARYDLEARRASHRDSGDTGGRNGGGEDGRTHVGGYGGVETRGGPDSGGGALPPPPELQSFRGEAVSFVFPYGGWGPTMTG